MPPERSYDWDEPRSMPYYMRGSRSYFDFSQRNVVDEITGSPGKEDRPGILKPIRSLLSRLGLLG